MKTTLFVISIANPILIGIYKDGLLIETFEKEGKTSEILAQIVDETLQKHKLNEIIYVNGPGSYMSIKIAYIFLKTLSITMNIPLLAMSGFSVNNNSPIKALGQKYFFLSNDNTISLKLLEHNEVVEKFLLPTKINYMLCLEESLPNYQLPVIS